MICEHCGKEVEHNLYEDTLCPYCGQTIEASEIQLSEPAEEDGWTPLRIFFTVFLMIIFVPVVIILFLLFG